MDKQISIQMQKMIHLSANTQMDKQGYTNAEMHRDRNPIKSVARFPNPLAFGSEWFEGHG